ncbi:hypothetical protein ACOMHN_026970 [Nucella lapillus]
MTTDKILRTMPAQWRCRWTQIDTTIVVLILTWNCAFALDVKPQEEIYTPDYTVYHNLTHTAQHLRKLGSKYTEIIHIDWSYKSRNGLPQLLARITNFSLPTSKSGQNVYVEDSKAEDVHKVRVLLSYGEHAREFFPVESFFYLLKNLTDGLSSRQGSHEELFSRMVLSHFDIFAIVMANPDGRRIVESSKNYCWRGTSTGVDIDRNFDWQFAQKGSSGNPGDEEFRGPFAFSEPECKVFVDLTERVQFDAFLSFHTGVRHIYMPFADTTSKKLKRVPPYLSALSDLASKMSRATKHRFLYGKAYDLNFYTADGTAFDYMAGVRQIPFSLALEIWENRDHTGRSCFDQFNPHSQRLMEELEAFHPMYVEMFSFLHQWKLQQSASASQLSAMKDPPTLALSYLLLATSLCLFVLMAYRYRHYLWSTKRRIVHLRRLSSSFSMGGIFR